MTWKRRWQNLRHGTLLVIVAVYSIFPIYFMVIQSLKTPQEDVHGNPLIVSHPTYDNYLELFEPPAKPRGYLRLPSVPFLLWVQNSAVVLLASLVVTLVISTLAAYGLGRLHPPGWRWWRRLLLASYLIPHTILFVPLYQVVVTLDLDNNILALVLVYQMLAMPFCVWLLSAYFYHLPRDIEEAAYIEGAGRIATFIRLVLPMSRPVLVAAGIFALGTIASDFMLASMFLTGAEHQTVAAGLGTMDVSLEELTVVAGVNLAAIPVVLICTLFAHDFVRGITAAMLEGA